MTPQPLSIVVLGLSLSSSWGNGHATTWRALIRGLRAEGHRVLFLERDKPWYAAHRDLAEPDFCNLALYDELSDLETHRQAIGAADAVIVGSYVPDGVAVIDRVADMRPRTFHFYDIDTPITMAMLADGGAEYVARRQIPLFDIYFSFAGGDVPGRLESEFGARRAEALFCAVDDERYFPTGEAPVWDLGYLGTYSADRQPALERLLLEPARRLPDRRFIVAGSGYPPEIAWPSNLVRIEHLDPSRHRSFYNRLRFALNVTRADMIAAGSSPSVRLFEAAACGTPLVSDRWRGLEQIFPEGSLAIADGTEDVVALLTSTGEAARRAMAAKAKRLVLTRHTGRIRARQLAEAIMSVEACRLTTHAE